jgi:hypothetical protein
VGAGQRVGQSYGVVRLLECEREAEDDHAVARLRLTIVPLGT